MSFLAGAIGHHFSFGPKPPVFSELRTFRMSRSLKRKNSNEHDKSDKAPQSASRDDLLIVAVGASAGGIEAFTDLISHLPVDTGMAYVLIQHLDPKHHSLLTELVAKKT